MSGFEDAQDDLLELMGMLSGIPERSLRFRDMRDTYADRMVDRLEREDLNLFISTAAVNDGQHPFETAVAHPEYNDCKIVIVEAYDTREAAQVGHDKWVKKMTASKLPAALTEANNSDIQRMCTKLGDGLRYPRKKAAL